MRERKQLSKRRIYVCHTFYHVYVAMLKECNLPLRQRGEASLVLSKMSNDFGGLKERAEGCGLFEAVYEYDEKEDTFFPELGKYKKNRGNMFLNMLSRIRYCKLLGRLQEPYVPVDFREYKDIYDFKCCGQSCKCHFKLLLDYRKTWFSIPWY